MDLIKISKYRFWRRIIIQNGSDFIGDVVTDYKTLRAFFGHFIGSILFFIIAIYRGFYYVYVRFYVAPLSRCNIVRLSIRRGKNNSFDINDQLKCNTNRLNASVFIFYANHDRGRWQFAN